jgi:hypothetical protein
MSTASLHPFTNEGDVGLRIAATGCW